MSENFKVKNCDNCKYGSILVTCEKLKGLLNKDNNNEIMEVSTFSEKWFKDKEIKEKHCCNDFKSIWIEYPLVISKIENTGIDYNDVYDTYDRGKLVKIRPCAKEYDNKTFLGVHLGNLPIGINVSSNSETKDLTLSATKNPAIYVFDLNKIIFGCESWWGVIKDEKELKDISDDDIGNVWYVKLLNKLN